MTLKMKYEALKELDKNRPNKEVAIQFSVPGSTLATYKKKEEIYQAFQNSSLKRQRVKMRTYEGVCSQRIDPLISKLTRIVNQGRRDTLRQLSINNFFK